LTLGVTAATDLLPILWNFDNGVIWPGVSGTVTVNVTGNALLSLRNYNNIEANNERLILINSFAAYGNAAAILFNVCNTSGVLVDISAHTTSHGGSLDFATGTHINIHIKKKNSFMGLIRAGFVAPNDAPVFINPTLELLGATNSPNLGALFVSQNNYQGSLTVFGGECFGIGCVDLQPVAISSGNAAPVCLYGFKSPRNMPLCLSIGNNTHAVSTGGDGAVGSSYYDAYFAADSRSDGYYPTLNAQLETSGNGGWSYRVYPYAVTQQKPARVPVTKLYSQAAAAKTITAHFLWPQGLAAPTTDKVYMTVGYTDNATGNKVFLSTKTVVADVIPVGSAAWSAATYGPTLFSKRSISIATPGNIKQDTEISVSLLFAVRAGASNDILFVDPDFTLT
jgi:hypothetical protein